LLVADVASWTAVVRLAGVSPLTKPTYDAVNAGTEPPKGIVLLPAMMVRELAPDHRRGSRNVDSRDRKV
jgi:hypothetical protein